MRPYQPRPVLFRGIHHHDGWRIKRYGIHLPDQTFEPGRFDDAARRSFRALPSSPDADGRFAAAVLIAHQGAGVDYLVLVWWDRENELPIRVHVRDGGVWREAREGESVCVWDLGVLWSERQAWVRHMMAADGPDLDAYLADLAPHAV